MPRPMYKTYARVVRRGFTPLERRSSLAGFTLVEIVVIVIVISILAVLAFAAYTKVISKSEDSEALVNLAAIRKAELSKHDETGAFVNATNTQDINDKLTTPTIQDKIFRYKVINATRENFTAVAERILGGRNVTEEPIVVAMYADGGFSSTISSVVGSSGSGGSFGGGSFGGGGSGGGSFGGGGSGGGGSGGGSSGGGGGSGGGSCSGGGGTGSGSSGGSSGGSDPGGGSGGGGTGSTPLNGLFIYSDPKLDAALSLLESAVNGAYFFDLINDSHITVSYTDLSSVGAIGLYIPPWWLDFYPAEQVVLDAIYISDSFITSSSWSSEAIAVILVHEAFHADYSHNTEKWVSLTTERYGIDRSEMNWYLDPVTSEYVLGDTIDQEYNAFVQEALLWREIRGVQTNAELDYVLSLYEQDEALGTSTLYDVVARVYQGYASYRQELR